MGRKSPLQTLHMACQNCSTRAACGGKAPSIQVPEKRALTGARCELSLRAAERLIAAGLQVYARRSRSGDSRVDAPQQAVTTVELPWLESSARLARGQTIRGHGRTATHVSARAPIEDACELRGAATRRSDYSRSRGPERCVRVEIGESNIGSSAALSRSGRRRWSGDHARDSESSFPRSLQHGSEVGKASADGVTLVRSERIFTACRKSRLSVGANPFDRNSN
jgi:hypothetical protein